MHTVSHGTYSTNLDADHGILLIISHELGLPLGLHKAKGRPYVILV